MSFTETLGLILAILTAATALAIQLQRLLMITEHYMTELRDQNKTLNLANQELIAAAQSASPIRTPDASTLGTDAPFQSASSPATSVDVSVWE